MIITVFATTLAMASPAPDFSVKAEPHPRVNGDRMNLKPQASCPSPESEVKGRGPLTAVPPLWVPRAYPDAGEIRALDRRIGNCFAPMRVGDEKLPPKATVIPAPSPRRAK